MTEGSREPEDIIAEALSKHAPKHIFVGFSGGHDSLVAAHWMMSNVPGCRVVHINTGIGIEAARWFVRGVCALYDWSLDEVRAKEDCGQDYDEIVKRFGFPGPAGHRMMYARLKERCVEKLVRDNKEKRFDRVLIATGLYQGESQRRAGYGSRVINRKGAQVWVNPLYWWPQERFDAYRKEHGLPRSYVKDTLGMSGECLCGAFAHKGEKALVRIVCPESADRIDRLEREVAAEGWAWGWEERPPRGQKAPRTPPGPMCVGCEKHFTPDGPYEEAFA